MKTKQVLTVVELVKNIDDQLKYLSTVDMSSQEALNSNIFGRGFVSIADTFIGLMQTFKTNVFKFPKSLKRSEIKEFIESNTLKVKTVNCITFDKVLNLKINVPANMSVTYAEALTTLTEVYVKLNALNTAKMVDLSLVNILKSLTNEDKKVTNLISSSASVIGKTVEVSSPIVAVCQKNFAGSNVRPIEFSKAFASMEEFRQVQIALLDNEIRLQNVNDLKNFIEHIEETLKSICNLIQSNQEIMQKQDVNALGNTAKGLALIFEAYSMTATRQMALEHNIILCINDIYSKVK